MRRLLLWPAVVLMLLVGCSSLQKGPELEPPQVIRADANAPRAEVQAELSDGVKIAALINKNYNENTTSCTEYGTGAQRGYYWCTGVLLRTTDNGAFNPWEASPTAFQLGGTSYSWIRHDLNTATFYKRAGFILLSPADAMANAVPGITAVSNAVTCVYPFDAYTVRTMTRKAPGCDWEGTAPGVWPAPWGTCDRALGFTTAEQWNAHFRPLNPAGHLQCSWSADTGQFWRNMIVSHHSFSGQSSWNEVMLRNWGEVPSYRPIVNEQTRKWVVAFFYDTAKAGSLDDARAFQQKMAATGKRVPILRLSFTAPAAQRFEFQQSDQAAGQYP